MTISVQSIIESCFEYYSTKDVYYGLDEERISGSLGRHHLQDKRKKALMYLGEMDNASEE